jgi:HEPN domain-containing protein
MQEMPLDRPPRPPAIAITERVRRAILVAASRANLDASKLLERHAGAESLDVDDVVDAVEERYGLEPKSLLSDPQSQLRLGRIAAGRSLMPGVAIRAYAECVLYALPDPEFLTVIEHAVADDVPGFVTDGEDLADAAGKILEAHGCAFRREPPNWPHFEWVGDPKQHELVIQPALRALEDLRLQGGPRDDFERALRKRRAGATKDLEDAIVAAARSVESVLKVLHEELAVPRPKTEVVSELFKSLKGAPLPGHVANLVTAAAGPRNYVAHGPGGRVREVPEELADASIAAAATAITFLAHYLP